MFKFKEVKKLVVNLDRRPERVIEFQREMDFMGWEFERFSAVIKIHTWDVVISQEN